MRTIAVFTSSRADYSHLRPVLTALRDHDSVDLRLIVTGTHLAAEHGMTVDVIERDGFDTSERVEILVAGDTSTAATASSALCLLGVANSLDRVRPDLLVVLGDRFETLAAAQASLLARIPIAHIHGGEVTRGAIDDSIRHAITKLAHLHFVATAEFARRVEQLGEDSDRIHVVGAPGLDTLRLTETMSLAELEESLGIAWTKPVFLVTMHPTTLHPGTALASTEALVSALDRFAEATVIITRANVDPEGDRINTRLAGWAAERGETAKLVPSLGPERYASAMRHADVVVGNSSSGIIEAPFLGTPSVDIGDRQEGRPRARSVLHSDPDADSIADAIRTALDPAFRATLAEVESRYGDGTAGPRIASILQRTPLSSLLLKSFRDLEGA